MRPIFLNGMLGEFRAGGVHKMKQPPSKDNRQFRVVE
jgi:hypothetical protein